MIQKATFPGTTCPETARQNGQTQLYGRSQLEAYHAASGQPGDDFDVVKLSRRLKQRWDFSDQYEHLEADPKRKKLEAARRLSWRECARIQTFDAKFTPIGDTESKFTQIGNAVPPKLYRPYSPIYSLVRA